MNDKDFRQNTFLVSGCNVVFPTKGIRRYPDSNEVRFNQEADAVNKRLVFQGYIQENVSQKQIFLLLDPTRKLFGEAIL